jgi:hypothetical protein
MSHGRLPQIPLDSSQLVVLVQDQISTAYGAQSRGGSNIDWRKHIVHILPSIPVQDYISSDFFLQPLLVAKMRQKSATISVG